MKHLPSCGACEDLQQQLAALVMLGHVRCAHTPPSCWSGGHGGLSGKAHGVETD
jgi:hypothetical protein